MSDELCAKLGYQFSNLKLLKMALTHRSRETENNERLEFLGDAIINLIIAEALYIQFPFAQEGELSRWRASLINRTALGNLARSFNLGQFLILGPGELKSGGGQRDSILSCGMEAIIGAIYLDGGFNTVKNSVLKWYQPLLQTLSDSANHKDPKTKLQEYLQGKKIALPQYNVESIKGEAHQQQFMVVCRIEGFSHKTTGEGTSRRRAEQDAAEKMLRYLENDI